MFESTNAYPGALVWKYLIQALLGNGNKAETSGEISLLIMSFCVHLSGESALQTLEERSTLFGYDHRLGTRQCGVRQSPPEKFERVFAKSKIIWLKSGWPRGKEGPH